MASYPTYLHVFKARDGWRFHLKAQNGNIMFDGGQRYKLKAGAKRAGKAVVRAIRDADVILVVGDARETL